LPPAARASSTLISRLTRTSASRVDLVTTAVALRLRPLMARIPSDRLMIETDVRS
jgi:hypothetical protein